MAMEVVPFEEFERRTERGWAPRMQTSIYHDLEFDCACGKSHRFGDAVVLCELPWMHVVLTCPRRQADATCVKIKGLFRRRLISKYGSADG